MHISIGELLDRCRNDRDESAPPGSALSPGPNEPPRGTTLILRDKHGQITGSLVVQLLDTTARADKTAVDSGSHDVGRTLPASTPIPQSNAIEDSGYSIIDLLKRVADKTKIAAKSVGETAEVRVASSS